MSELHLSILNQLLQANTVNLLAEIPADASTSASDKGREAQQTDLIFPGPQRAEELQRALPQPISPTAERREAGTVPGKPFRMLWG